jgi:O-antigen/teichoic acid export membrane protein
VNILQSKTAKQTAILFGSQIALVAIGFGIKTIQTNVLGAEAYGLYAFFGSFTGFAVLFFRFGFFSSLQVLLAENNNPNYEKELFGLGFIINLFVGVLFATFIWITSFYIDSWFHIEIGNIIRLVAPLTIVIPSRNLISAMTVGSNKVQILPIYDNVAKVLFAIALLVFAFSDTLTVFHAILFNLTTLFISFGVIFRQFQPSFNHIKKNSVILLQKTKSYGFNFYIGSTANQSTFKLDEIAISYFIGTTVNGFYSLANLIASPMIMGSQALSNSLFKNFSNQTKIPRKVFVYNAAWLLFSMTILYFISDWIVELLFGNQFKLVAEYAVGISLALFFQGMYQPFNFLSAKSQGKQIRNVALIEASINLTGNLILIPQIGVLGAIYTSIFAKFIHFIGKWYYYNKYLKSI